MMLLLLEDNDNQLTHENREERLITNEQKNWTSVRDNIFKPTRALRDWSFCIQKYVIPFVESKSWPEMAVFHEN